MHNGWNLRRKEIRVAVSLPVFLEVDGEHCGLVIIESMAQDISRDGFRLDLGALAVLPPGVQLGRAYPVTLTFGLKAIRAVVEFVWENNGRCGLRFVERDKSWLIN
jgi:hypothetical protein